MALRLSILYVGSRCPQDLASADPHLSVACVNTPDAIKFVKPRPDIVLIDPFGHDSGVNPEKARLWFDVLSGHHFKFSLAVFIIVPEETNKHVRLSLISSGADQVVDWPSIYGKLKLRPKALLISFILNRMFFSRPVPLRSLLST
jgi:hypothetical protein